MTYKTNEKSFFEKTIENEIVKPVQETKEELEVLENRHVGGLDERPGVGAVPIGKGRPILLLRQHVPDVRHAHLHVLARIATLDLEKVLAGFAIPGARHHLEFACFKPQPDDPLQDHRHFQLLLKSRTSPGAGVLLRVPGDSGIERPIHGKC